MATTRRLTIAEGDYGTEQTVAVMAGLIRDGALLPSVRAVAVDVVTNLDSSDPLSQLWALRAWLAGHFQFVRDPASGELLHDADNLMRQVAAQGIAKGDCDDAAIFAGALACAVGFRVALVTVAVGDSRPAPFLSQLPYGHVWASASPLEAIRDESGRQVWIEFDVTRPMQSIPLNRIARSAATLVC
jgi:hypothetical protein